MALFLMILFSKFLLGSGDARNVDGSTVCCARNIKRRASLRSLAQTEKYSVQPGCDSAGLNNSARLRPQRADLGAAISSTEQATNTG
jgi:hypothetical protein